MLPFEGFEDEGLRRLRRGRGLRKASKAKTKGLLVLGFEAFEGFETPFVSRLEEALDPFSA